MRTALSLTALLLLSTPAWSEDVVLRADIREALFFGQGASLTRSAEVELPQGQHRLIIPARDAAEMARLDLAFPEGVRVGIPEVVSRWAIAEGALDSPEEAAARDALEAAEAAFSRAEDALAFNDAALRGTEAQIAYLTSLSGSGTESTGDPAQVLALLSTLGEELEAAHIRLLEAQTARRELEDMVSAAASARDAARLRLADLEPYAETSPALVIDVDVEAPVTGLVTLSYFTERASWSPWYRADLSTETGSLRLNRHVTLHYDGTARFRDVAVTVSTDTPNRQAAPTDLTPSPARLIDPAREIAPMSARSADAVVMETALAPMAGLVPPLLDVEVEGLSVRYGLPQPVRLTPGRATTVAMDELSWEVELEAVAVPRWDSTAFLMANGRNEDATPILPGPAQLYRDGGLIGEIALPMVAPGARFELAYGALDHLRLTWQDVARDEEDRGVFVNRNAQARVLTFGVENTSAEPENIRLLYATPFSEQEDLELNLGFSLAPTERNTEDRRGVHAWDLNLAPGQETTIEMTVDLAWPEEQVLTWRP